MAFVFKFGGASIKDAGSVQNMARIVSSYNENLIIVVSAMGKMTRALHKLTEAYFNRQDVRPDLTSFWAFHYEIINGLSLHTNPDFNAQIKAIETELENKLEQTPSSDFDFEYDQIVSYGEIVSSVIVSHYLNTSGISNQWVDIRQFLKTDSIYRDARINWSDSEILINRNFIFSKNKIYITQGFIASNEKNYTTTLGLEGSDFSAAALSYFIQAEKLIVWKDVPGIYNSDPNEFENITKLDAISYQEAAELAYYGAKVIHPKTIKPLENRNIPLWVKSFKEPAESGTVITLSTSNKVGVEPLVPIFISKHDQILISIAPNDFSFIAEDNLEHIFSILAKFRIKVNLMQNSAISFSVCVDDIEEKVVPAIENLKQRYKVLYNKNLTLITIRHFDEETIHKTTKGREIIVQQKSRHTARFVVK